MVIKIGIIGNGFVGKATQILAQKENQENQDNQGEVGEVGEVGEDVTVMVYDIRPEACIPLGTTLLDLETHCDVLFFCLPTPLNHDGTCYTQLLEDSIRSVNHPFKVVRSTVPVGFSQTHACYFMPEFLTEANWRNDFRNTTEWVLGLPCADVVAMEDAGSAFKVVMHRLFTAAKRNGAIQSCDITWMSSNDAEMLKLAKNCFLSAKVGIMNEMYDFCTKLTMHGITTGFKTVTDVMARDPRIGATHMQVPGPDGKRGFGGTCFPKDTHSLYAQMLKHGVDAHIYASVLARNDCVDRAQREWNTDVWRTTLPVNKDHPVIVICGRRGELTHIMCEQLLQRKESHVLFLYDGADVDADDVDTILKWKNHAYFHHRKINYDYPLFLPHVDEIWLFVEDLDLLQSPSQLVTYSRVRRRWNMVTHLLELWKQHPGAQFYSWITENGYTHDGIAPEKWWDEHGNVCGVFPGEYPQTTEKLIQLFVQDHPELELADRLHLM